MSTELPAYQTITFWNLLELEVSKIGATGFSGFLARAILISSE
jgi:hypothetical protein